MTEDHDPARESSVAASAQPDGDDSSRPEQLADVVAKAAESSGLGALARSDQQGGRALLAALGGVRGLLEAVVPSLTFVVLFTLTSNVPLSIGVSVATAVILTVLRVLTKSSVAQAMAGLIGVGISAILALVSGRGADNFVLGLMIDAVYGIVFFVSVVVRWPLLGVAAGYLMGDGVAWRSSRPKLRVMQLLTLLWVALFAARLLVQAPLYFAGTDQATTALGFARLLMGIPLYAPLLVVSWLVVKAQFPQRPQK